MLAALSRAFAAPVLFQYNNVIFLVAAGSASVGPASAIDRYLRSGRKRGAVRIDDRALASKPSEATRRRPISPSFSEAGYAAILTLRERDRPWPRRRTLALTGVATLAVWVVSTLSWKRTGSSRCPAGSARSGYPRSLPGARRGAGFAWRWYEGKAGAIAPRLAGGRGAGALAGAIAAVQILPVAEFATQSGRASGIEPTNGTKFSIEPYRLAELVWPWIYGVAYPENRTWIQILPPAKDRQLWEPSLYVGGVVLLLGVGAARIRGARRRGGSGSQESRRSAWRRASAGMAVRSGGHAGSRATKGCLVPRTRFTRCP